MKFCVSIPKFSLVCWSISISPKCISLWKVDWATTQGFPLVLQSQVAYRVHIGFSNFPNYPLLDSNLIWCSQWHPWSSTHTNYHSIFEWCASTQVSQATHVCVRGCSSFVSNMQFHLRDLHSRFLLPTLNCWQCPWSISANAIGWLLNVKVGPYHVMPTRCWWDLHLGCKVQLCPLNWKSTL